jgi:hypothetical protein
MICKFTVGQKVLCIEDCECEGFTGPRAGTVYAIREIWPFGINLDDTVCQIPCLELEEMPGTYCWEHTEFRALDDQILEPFWEYCLRTEDALHDLMLHDHGSVKAHFWDIWNAR